MVKTTREILEDYYNRYHRVEFIDPDPLLFPRRYSKPADIEASAFISAAFALGRVNLIVSFLERVFSVLGAPCSGLTERSEKDLEGLFSDFRYRFYSSEDIIHFMKGIRLVYLEYGSIENCFMRGYKNSGTDDYSPNAVISGLTEVARAVNREGSFRNVVSNPLGGSACKRLFLFLRWVVRKDNIDPGMWNLKPSELVIPLDTHVMKVGQYLGLTNRKSADLRTAEDITQSLKLFDKEDPVKYDFSMSRIGIHPDLDYSELEKDIGA